MRSVTKSYFQTVGDVANKLIIFNMKNAFKKGHKFLLNTKIKKILMKYTDCNSCIIKDFTKNCICSETMMFSDGHTDTVD